MKNKKFRVHDFNAETYFNKIYYFKSNDTWVLPSKIFTDKKWSIPELQAKKKELNAVKEQLNDFDLEQWSLHTKKRDPSSLIIRTIRNRFKPELLTQAWCKFYECLSKLDLLPKNLLNKDCLRTLHLCEAPGGFISALNHYLVLYHPNVKLDWMATTLNPDYEGNPLVRMIPDDRLIRFTKANWLFGSDHTGDITKFYNHEYLVSEYLKKGKASLITADGSVNCMDDPGDQERNVEFLHYCEVITALELLETGGTLVLKIFTIFEESTICLLYLLNCSFQSVTLFKPITSKSGNSEIYVICKGYKGIESLSIIRDSLLMGCKRQHDVSLFDYKDINETFITQICECVDFFMKKQIITINENIKHFLSKNYHNHKLKTVHEEITNYFLKKYHLDVIPNSRKIVPERNITNCYKLYQFVDDFTNYRYYCDKNDKEIIMNIKTGERVEKIYYSKYCTQEILPEILNQNFIAHENSLCELIKNQLSDKCTIFDVKNLPSMSNNANFQKQLFLTIRRDLADKSNVLFINVPFLSNFSAGILYIISTAFKCTYFLRQGLILLKDCDTSKAIKVGKFLDEINNVYETLTYFDSINFQVDILELFNNEFSDCFVNGLWFYNNNLRYKKY